MAVKDDRYNRGRKTRIRKEKKSLEHKADVINKPGSHEENWLKRRLEAEIAKNNIWGGSSSLQSNLDSLTKEFPGSNMPIMEAPEGVTPVPLPEPKIPSSGGYKSPETKESNEKIKMFKEIWAKRRSGEKY